MKPSFYLIVLGIAVNLVATSCKTSMKEPELHLYLLAGQSNMAGRGVLAEEDTSRHPRVFVLSGDNAWVQAADPLHFDKPDLVGVGPGLAFGKAMADANPELAIGLIPAAVGGSSIRQWLPGADHPQTNSRPWDDALRRTYRVLALEGGALKGILWHQGESDGGGLEDAEAYKMRLDDLVQRFRDDFHDPDLPFIAAMLSPFYEELEPHARIVNSAIKGLPDRVSNTAVVSGDGLTPKEDGIHLNAGSARELGRRFAQTVQGLESRSDETR